MQTNNVGGQMSLFGADGLFGKTFPEHFQAENPREQTSKSPSRKSSKSQTPPLPMCLCLRGGDGQSRDASTMRWEDGAWPGGYTMHSITVYPNGEKGFAYWLTSADSPHPRYCLSLNLSERPRVANPTRLSDILEENADPKYNLSSRACQGILNRAAKRGKQLPEILKTALENQVSDETD